MCPVCKGHAAGQILVASLAFLLPRRLVLVAEALLAVRLHAKLPCQPLASLPLLWLMIGQGTQASLELHKVPSIPLDRQSYDLWSSSEGIQCGAKVYRRESPEGHLAWTNLYRNRCYACECYTSCRPWPPQAHPASPQASAACSCPAKALQLSAKNGQTSFTGSLTPRQASSNISACSVLKEEGL